MRRFSAAASIVSVGRCRWDARPEYTARKMFRQRRKSVLSSERFIEPTSWFLDLGKFFRPNAGGPQLLAINESTSGKSLRRPLCGEAERIVAHLKADVARTLCQFYRDHKFVLGRRPLLSRSMAGSTVAMAKCGRGLAEIPGGQGKRARWTTSFTPV